MRILFVGPVPPLRGGIAQHGARLVEALRAEHTVRVVTWKALYPRSLYRHAQRDEAAAALEGAEARLAWWSPFSWRAAGLLGREQELVVLPWVTPFHWLACRTIAGAAAPVPTVAIVHNALPHEPMPMQRRLTRWGLERVAGAVVHSEEVRAELAELVAPPRTELVAHPPNLALEPSPLVPRPPLRLLFLGFVRDYKGLDVALDALVLLGERGRDVRLSVAGEFWDPLEDWRTRIVERGLGSQVTLHPGYQEDATVRRLLAEHHVLVAPYKSATQSGVVPLAQAAGRPSVATDVGGLAAQVGAGGVVVPSEDPAAFADGVERVADDLEAYARAAAGCAGSWRAVAAACLRAGGVA